MWQLISTTSAWQYDRIPGCGAVCFNKLEPADVETFFHTFDVRRSEHFRHDSSLITHAHSDDEASGAKKAMEDRLLSLSLGGSTNKSSPSQNALEYTKYTYINNL